MYSLLLILIKCLNLNKTIISHLHLLQNLLIFIACSLSPFQQLQMSNKKLIQLKQTSSNHKLIQQNSSISSNTINLQMNIKIPTPKKIGIDPSKKNFYSNKKEILQCLTESKKIIKSPRSNTKKQLRQQINKNQKRKEKVSLYQHTINQFCDILDHFMNQSQINQHKLQQPAKVLYEYQHEQISKMMNDPHLGDFIIKLPNADNPSDQYMQLYNTAKQKDFEPTVNFDEALIYYNNIFNTQGKTNQNIMTHQKIAFIISFYLLNLQEKFVRENGQNSSKNLTNNQLRKLQQTKLKIKQSDIRSSTISTQIKQLLESIDYYKKIKEMTTQKYKFQRPKDDTIVAFQKKHQKFDPTRNIIFRTILKQDNQIKYFKYIKQELFEPIQKELLNLTISQTRIEVIDRLLIKYQKFSDIFRLFPCLIEKFISFENSANIQLRRKLVKGKLLQKTVFFQNLIWVNSQSAPKDFVTLMRNCITYQLTQRCSLYVRQFLSKDQKHIFIVSKATQGILEAFAQQKQVQMELDLGATDPFSFQPVDMYLRPLRLNQYLTDFQFIKKYSLHSNKMDKDEQLQGKSVQSQAVNIFKRAQKMNADQLRAKIILDQQDADRHLRWISRTLNIKLIDHEVALTNQFNNRQISRQTWQCYYLYNKIIISSTKRIKKMMSVSKSQKQYWTQLHNNIGFIFRLMFLKALSICNEAFLQHRQNRRFIPLVIQNLFQGKKLKSIWDYMKVTEPHGFTSYVNNKQLERIWRKYQINQNKGRSKFFPSQRLIIAHKIITNQINVSKALQKMHIVDYYPLHDPFILKNIEISPYLINLRKKTERIISDNDKLDPQIIKNLYIQFQCEQTKSDFTKMSIQNKLSFTTSIFREFSTESVRYYCGEKIAIYFQCMKFFAKKAYPIIIPAFLMQIFLWAEQGQITKNGYSSLTPFCNFLIFVFTFVNMVWTTHVVQNWKNQQIALAQKFGVTDISEQNQKRVKFVGSFKRNIENDEMNFQYVPAWKVPLKSIFTFLINLVYVVFVALVIISVFILKAVMFQTGYSQTAINVIPSILISIIVQIFNFLYGYLIKLITQFQNHKTISDYESSLISKSYVVTFVITFNSIFIYAFFSQYLDSGYLCLINPDNLTTNIVNCDYFVSGQLLSLVIVDLIFTIIAALLPYIKFKVKQYLRSIQQKSKTKFCFNKFQAIDEFYQEQDHMETYMFNEEIDKSWMGYMNVINVFTALALFGPALPFVYVMMFVSGVVRLHAGKYEVIYLMKRSLPIKSNSIHWWLRIMQIISILSIITNLSYMIYTRNIFNSQDQSQIFFFFLVIFLIMKFYLLSSYGKKENLMEKRNRIKVHQLIRKKGNQNNKNLPQTVNTDLINVIYREQVLKRKLPQLAKAKIRN